MDQADVSPTPVTATPATCCIRISYRIGDASAHRERHEKMIHDARAAVRPFYDADGVLQQSL
jgi:hypothetical protein